MRSSRTTIVLAAIGIFSLSLQACKTKKLVAKPTPQVSPKEVERPVEKPPVEEKEETAAPAESRPDYNFSNVQFEFNSGVLKTASFEILDKVAREMKKDTAVKFILNGHSSAEGTEAHNMSLSVDRANAVKSYLVNAGIAASNLSIKGYGATQPLTANTTEEGKALNRRVEIKVNP